PAASLNSQGQAGQAGSVVGSSGFGSTQSSAQYTNGPSSDGSGSTFAGSPTQGAQYTPGPGSDGSGGSFGGGSTGSTAADSQPGNSLGISPFANSVNGQTGPPGSPTGNAFGQNSAGGNQTFGGGAIVGVASLSKDPTIRIYNKKKKYNEWQFIYDPMSDRANVLLRGPYQPLTLGGAQVGTPAGQINGQQQSPFGQQPGPFGQQPGSPPQQTGPGQTGPRKRVPTRSESAATVE